MSASEPFLPLPVPGERPEAAALPDDDLLPGELEGGGAQPEGGGQEGAPTRPSRFVTPAPHDGLDDDALRRDLAGG